VSDAPRPLVTLSEALFIHTVAVEAGEVSGLGVRDHGAVESALHRPVAGFGGKLRYKTPEARAATLWWGLIKNHPFVDANERTATAVMHRWLDREGYWLRASHAEQIETAVDIAQDRLGVEQLTSWIRERMQPHAGVPHPPRSRTPSVHRRRSQPARER
jgi:death on curing protein